MAIQNKKTIIIILIVAALVIAGGVYLFFNTGSRKAQNNGINYAPATKTEKKESEDNKDRIIREQEEAGQNPGTPEGKAVTPVISTAGVYDGNVEVSSFVPGIFEEGGLCTITLTKGSQTVTRAVTGLENVSSVQCPTAIIPLSEFSAGDWEARVSYKSSTAQGTSASNTIEVQ